MWNLVIQKDRVRTGCEYPASKVLNPSSLTFRRKVAGCVSTKLCSAVTQSVEWGALIQLPVPSLWLNLALLFFFPFTMMDLLPVTQTFLPKWLLRQQTISAVQLPPHSHSMKQWGNSELDSRTICTTSLYNKVPRATNRCNWTFIPTCIKKNQHQTWTSSHWCWVNRNQSDF